MTFTFLPSVWVVRPFNLFNSLFSSYSITCVIPDAFDYKWASFVAHMVKRLPAKQENPGFNPWVRKIPWRRKWQPIPGFLRGKFPGLRILVDYSPWGRKELDTTEQLHCHFLTRNKWNHWTEGGLEIIHFFVIMANRVSIIFKWTLDKQPGLGGSPVVHETRSAFLGFLLKITRCWL